MKIKKIENAYDNVECTIIEAKTWITSNTEDNKRLKVKLENNISREMAKYCNMKDSIVTVKFNEKDISSTNAVYLKSKIYVFDSNPSIEGAFKTILKNNKIIKINEFNKSKKRR